MVLSDTTFITYCTSSLYDFAALCHFQQILPIKVFVNVATNGSGLDLNMTTEICEITMLLLLNGWFLKFIDDHIYVCMCVRALVCVSMYVPEASARLLGNIP